MKAWKVIDSGLRHSGLQTEVQSNNWSVLKCMLKVTDFPIKRLQKLKAGNNPLNKTVTLKCITNISELWWCKWATSSIAVEGKISLPRFYFLPDRSREPPLTLECRVIRKNTSAGTGDALGIISSTITSCLCKFWLCIIQDRWNPTYFCEYFDVFRTKAPQL